MLDTEFTFQTRDEFNRRPFAERIINLLKSDIDISPMAIDGAWGTGKSEFCIKTLRLIEQEHRDSMIPIYINAFAEDHVDKPLETILSSLYATFSENESKKEILQQLLNVGIQLGSIASKTLLTSLFPAGLKVIDNAVDIVLGNIFQQHAQANKKIEELKKSLSSLTNQKQKIVIFVDELDRCRPDFAVHFLEVLKHIFEIENIRIVLVCNLDLLRDAISHQYGISNELKGKYLEKFISYKVKLPEIVEGGNDLVSVEYLNTLLSQYCRLNVFFDDKNIRLCDYSSKQVIFELIKKFNPTLRQVETFVRYLRIFVEINTLHLTLGVKVLVAFSLLSLSLDLNWLNDQSSDAYSKTVRNIDLTGANKHKNSLTIDHHLKYLLLDEFDSNYSFHDTEISLFYRQIGLDWQLHDKKNRIEFMKSVVNQVGVLS